MAAQGLTSELESVVRHARDALDAHGLEWALVGGLAVSARAEPRFTRDADFAVALADDRAAETVVRDFQARGYRVLTVLEHETTGRLATVRLQPPGGGEHGVVLDLLFASSGIEPEVVGAATPLEAFPGLELPVARVGELLALKILARDDERRPQDRVDIVALLEEATEDDLKAATRALRLIIERGCHRERDLLADLQAFVDAKRRATGSGRKHSGGT